MCTYIYELHARHALRDEVTHFSILQRIPSEDTKLSDAERMTLNVPIWPNPYYLGLAE
jgi:hypothetical protein